LIKAIYANIVTGDLFSMQSMGGPTGLVWFVDFVYGSSKGGVSRGQKMYDALRGPQTGEQDYASEKISSESLGLGTGAVKNYTGNLSYLTVRAGSVQIGDGTQTVQDNGQGVLAGTGTGTINYLTGEYDVTFTDNVADQAQVVADYEYNSESANMGANSIPEVDIQLTSQSVTAQPYRLRAVWTQDAEQDLYNQFGIAAQSELIGFTGNEVQKEIYNKMIRQARTIAPGGYVSWDSNVPLAVPEVLHRQSMPLRFTAASNKIFERTQRWGANWLVCGPNAATYIEALPTEFFSRNTKIAGAGVHKIGTLSTGQDVYKDPAYPTNEGVFGYKGNAIFEAGIIQAVYVGLYSTDVVKLDDFRSRVGLGSRLAIKVVNANLYQKFSITTSA